jgi:vacuolar-type H+-ATPase subunit E/Vma4
LCFSAKKEMLEEVGREKQALRTEAQLEAQQQLHQQIQQAVQAAKTEWLKAAGGKDENVAKVHALYLL